MVLETIATGVVQHVNPLKDPGWDAWVGGCSHCSFFHGSAWARVLVDTYGFVPHYFTMDHAALPVMEVNSWMTGRRGIGLPFTDDCEPPGAGRESFGELFQSAVEFGRSRGWKYLECRGGREWLPDAPASLSFHGHYLDLGMSEGRLFARLESSTQRAIRKAEKNGVSVDVSQSAEAMKMFYTLQCKTRKKHGLPPQPFAFFKNIHKHIVSRKLGMVVTASHQNRPIAASIYFLWGNQAIYKYGASDEAFQQLRGNNLVMWEAMKWLARNGVTRLHLGRTSLGNEGLRRWKLGWGARQERIEYVKYDIPADRFVLDRDEASGWHNHIFRGLPASLSRLVGAALYRHWA